MERVELAADFAAAFELTTWWDWGVVVLVAGAIVGVVWIRINWYNIGE